MFPLQSPEREDFCSSGRESGSPVGWEVELQAQPSIKLVNLRSPHLQAEELKFKTTA